MENTGWIPETIGKPIQIIYWSASEVIVPILIFIVGFMIDYYIQSIALFLVYCYVYSKKKEEIPKGYTINFLYMAGLLTFKTVPTYFAARFEE